MKQYLKKIKKVKLLVAFLIIATTANAQEFYKLSGKVYNENNQPLSNATVKLLDKSKATATDINGYFEFQVKKGSYGIEATFIGYESKMQLIEVINSNQIVNFYVLPSTEKLNEVLVSATRANKKTPITFTNVTKKELESKNLGQDLPMLLDQLPSVVTTSDAGAGVGYTGIRVRGSDSKRVNVTINGIPYNDPESHGTFWVNMPDFSSSIEDIQLQRGVGTSTNGSGAFGASLNIKTQKPSNEAQVTTSHTIGSYNTKKHNINLSSGIINSFYANVRLSKISSDGYIDRSASDLKSFYTEAGYLTDKTSIKAIVFGGHEITQQAWYGTPEAVILKDVDGINTFLAHEDYSFSQDQIDNLNSNPGRTYNHYTYDNEIDNYKQSHYQLHFDHKVNNAYTFNVSGNYTSGKGYFEQYKPKEKVKKYFPESTNADEKGEVIRRRWLDNDFYALVYSLNYKQDNLNVIFGGGYNTYNGDHFGKIIWDSFPTEQIDYQTNYYSSIGEKTELNNFIKVEYELNKHIYTFVDLQYRGINYKAKGIGSKLQNIDIIKKYNFFNPKLGVTYTFNNHNSLYGSFSVANREPNRDDLTKNPITPKSENLQDVEFGYKFNNTNAYLTANLYYMNYKNQLVLTGDLDDVGDPIRQNVAKSYRAGIEIQTGYKFSDKFRIDANATFSKNKIKEFDYIVYDTQYDPITWDESYNAISTNFTDTNISFSPSIIAGGTLMYTPFKNLSLGWVSKYVGKQYLDNTSNDTKSIDAYFVNNFNTSFKFNPTWIEEITLNLLVNNIFSEKYVSNGYTYSYYYRAVDSADPAITEKFYYPQATRNFLLGATLRF